MMYHVVIFSAGWIACQPRLHTLQSVVLYGLVHKAGPEGIPGSSTIGVFRCMGRGGEYPRAPGPSSLVFNPT